jgi:hypothetical protein
VINVVVREVCHADFGESMEVFVQECELVVSGKKSLQRRQEFLQKKILLKNSMF